MVLMIFLFFFFQAEDGIRDIGVTGVQTCALPICHSIDHDRRQRGPAGRPGARSDHGRWNGRSEERRVGKECRSRWSTYHYKKKKRVGRAESAPQLATDQLAAPRPPAAGA